MSDTSLEKTLVIEGQECVLSHDDELGYNIWLQADSLPVVRRCQTEQTAILIAGAALRARKPEATQ